MDAESRTTDLARSRKRAQARQSPKCRMNRRQFLLTSGATTATVMVMMNAGTAFAARVPALVATYPRKLIVRLSDLQQDASLNYCWRRPSPLSC